MHRLVSSLRITLPCLALAFSGPTPAVAQTGDLQERIEARIALEGDSVEIGVALVDRGAGVNILLNADRSFHAASTMKVPVMIELYRRAEAEGFSVHDPVRIRNTFRSIADGSSFTLGADRDTELVEALGRELSFRRVAHGMITVSSNLATNILLEELVADSIQATMNRLGAGDMKVLRGVQDIPAFEQGMSNTTSARAYARALDAIVNCEITSTEACRDMMAILEDQRFTSDIPSGLPSGVRFGNKTGSITRIRHDGAIVAPEGRLPYVLVILTEGYSDSAAASALMREISDRVFRELVPTSEQQGRQPLSEVSAEQIPIPVG
jgi:beta-lactamase class A